MKDRHRQRGQTTLDLLEEAVHLLRTAPGEALGWYYLGALPFVLVLLYFWTDMSWSADAQGDCAFNAAAVALAFVWMKFCQAMFARQLGARIKLEAVPRTSLRGLSRMFLQQAVIQPSKLFVLPIALVVTFPFAWVCAFYENVTALGEMKNLRALCASSWKQAKLWPRQNHLTLSIFVLLYFVMAGNALLIVLTAPHLLKIFTGLENVFTRSGLHVLNSTNLAVVASITYLCCDPLFKAVYVLRCFYGQSLHSGEDLQVELRRVRQISVAALAATVAILLPCVSLFGAEASTSSKGVPNSEELDRAISETIAKPEFSWRMPREEVESKSSSAPPNAFDRFLRRHFHTLGKWWRSFWNWLESVMPKSSLPTPTTGGTGTISRSVLEICLVILCGILVVFLGAKIRDRYLQGRGTRRPVLVPSTVDLTEENVTADQLPEDEWLRLAGELLRQGDWRLALRAFFLAGLAHLSQREMIALARHKSNRDYQAELRRRAPAQSAVQEAFARNLLEVERAWYGRHDVTAGGLEHFKNNLETIRAL